MAKEGSSTTYSQALKSLQAPSDKKINPVDKTLTGNIKFIKHAHSVYLEQGLGQLNEKTDSKEFSKFLNKYVTAYNFYKKYQRPWQSDARILQEVDCIRYDKNVEVKSLPQGEVITQSQVAWGRQGSYFSTEEFSSDELGIADKGNPPIYHIHSEPFKVDDTKVHEKYKLRYEVSDPKGIEVLESTASPALDIWSVKGESVVTSGGGVQLYYPGPPNSVTRGIDKAEALSASRENSPPSLN